MTFLFVVGIVSWVMVIVSDWATMIDDDDE